MKIAIFAILIISMGIMISVSPEAHAIDLGVSHIIGDIKHHLNDSEIHNTAQDNDTSLEQNMNPPLKNNQDMDDIENNTDFTSKFIDVDNSIFDIYLS